MIKVMQKLVAGEPIDVGEVRAILEKEKNDG